MKEFNQKAFSVSAKIQQRRRKLQLEDAAEGETVTSRGIDSETMSQGMEVIFSDAFVAKLRSAEESAALTGYFHPDHISPDVQGDLRLLLLSHLVSNCNVQQVDGSMQWMLKQTRRKTILSDMIQQKALQEKLSQPLPPTGLFGEMLRKILGKEPPGEIKDMSQNELLALSHAIEALQDIPVGIPLPTLPEIRRKLEAGRFLSDYDVLLVKGFVGREDELGQLNDFLTQPLPAGKLWDGLLLTGVGGAGKSTLLAKFAKEQVIKKNCTVIVLDFDRPAFTPEDTHWLELEISRQVEQQYPEIDNTLHTARNESKQAKDMSEMDFIRSENEAVTESRGFRTVISSVGDVLSSKKVEHLPVLLVLDTFEEVSQRNLETKIFNWLNEISDRLYPIKLKVIFSGRLFKNTLAVFDGFKFRNIHVDEVEPACAERILINNDVPPEKATIIANTKSLPRRPLELNLIARIINNDPGFSLQQLEDDITASGKGTEELFVGLIYRRVLLRIGKDENDIVRQLACPGLVLHYVTIDLIQQVLVPALEIRPLTNDEAQAALDELANHQWLAYREGDAVWHSRDIRRSMLKLMIAKEPEKTTRIHEYAVQYFSRRNSAADRGEAIYHELMLVKTPEAESMPDIKEVQLSREYLDNYGTEFPKPAEVYYKYAVTGNIEVSELQYMPVKFRVTAYHTIGKHLYDNRELGQARQLIPDFSDLNTLSSSETGYAEWESETLYATAEWENLPQRFYSAAKRDALKPGVKRITETLYSASRPIFHAAVIFPESLDEDSMELFLSAIIAEKGYQYYSAEYKLMLSKIAFALVTLNNVTPFSEKFRERVNEFIKFIYELKSFTFSSGLKRNMFLLQLITTTQPAIDYHISSSSLKLDKEWIAKILTGNYAIEVNNACRNTLVNILHSIEGHSQASRQTVSSLLGKIDGLHKEQNMQMTIHLDSIAPAQLLELIKGPNREFRDPCRFALLEAFPDSNSWEQLAGFIASKGTLTFDDLAPDVFAKAMESDPEHVLENYIELVDRSYGMGDLLRDTNKERPDAAKLSKVLNAYTAWENAIKAVTKGRN